MKNNLGVRKIRCHDCEGTMIGQKGVHRYTECGLTTVILTDIMVYRCTHCSQVMPEIPAAGVLHRVIALRLISKKSRLTGEEIRFLRKLCGYSVNEFAEILGSSRNVVFRYEREGCGDSVNRAIKLLAMSKLARELAGESEPILRNLTVEQLIGDVEKSLKQAAERVRPEQYEISPEEIARFSVETTEPELAVVN
jgi:transcriptional regulator with XRE-family HTH domain